VRAREDVHVVTESDHDRPDPFCRAGSYPASTARYRILYETSITLAHAADGVRRIDSERCLTPTLALPLRCRLAPRLVRGAFVDHHLDRDELVVRLLQFHPLVIPGARC
jgi:hypothetical protein